MDALGKLTGVPHGVDPRFGIPLNPDGTVPRDLTPEEAKAASATTTIIAAHAGRRKRTNIQRNSRFSDR